MLETTVNLSKTVRRILALNRHEKTWLKRAASATAADGSVSLRVKSLRQQLLEAWLDEKLYLDHRDSRFKLGRVGLWTKADSLTAFDDLTIRGVTGGG